MSIQAQTRTPWTPNKRAILESMSDGEPHWAERLYQQLGMPRRHSAAHALGWLQRKGFLTSTGTTGTSSSATTAPTRNT